MKEANGIVASYGINEHCMSYFKTVQENMAPLKNADDVCMGACNTHQ